MNSAEAIFEIHSGLVLKGRLSMEKDVILTGRFEGDLRTLGRLTVMEGGTAVGSIEAGALVLRPGNKVEARIKISSPAVASRKAAAPPNPDKPGEGKWPLSLQKIKNFALGRA